MDEIFICDFYHLADSFKQMGMDDGTNQFTEFSQDISKGIHLYSPDLYDFKAKPRRIRSRKLHRLCAGLVPFQIKYDIMHEFLISALIRTV